MHLEKYLAGRYVMNVNNGEDRAIALVLWIVILMLATGNY